MDRHAPALPIKTPLSPRICANFSSNLARDSWASLSQIFKISCLFSSTCCDIPARDTPSLVARDNGSGTAPNEDSNPLAVGCGSSVLRRAPSLIAARDIASVVAPDTPALGLGDDRFVSLARFTPGFPGATSSAANLSFQRFRHSCCRSRSPSRCASNACSLRRRACRRRRFSRHSFLEQTFCAVPARTSATNLARHTAHR